MPETMSCSAAQSTPSVYQSVPTSVKGLQSVCAGSPSMRQSTLTSMERVIAPVGENVVSDVPTNRPCETA